MCKLGKWLNEHWAFTGGLTILLIIINFISNVVSLNYGFATLKSIYEFDIKPRRKKK